MSLQSSARRPTPDSVHKYLEDLERWLIRKKKFPSKPKMSAEVRTYFIEYALRSGQAQGPDCHPSASDEFCDAWKPVELLNALVFWYLLLMFVVFVEHNTSFSQ